jgi:hypothetical protein
MFCEAKAESTANKQWGDNKQLELKKKRKNEEKKNNMEIYK